MSPVWIGTIYLLEQWNQWLLKAMPWAVLGTCLHGDVSSAEQKPPRRNENIGYTLISPSAATVNRVQLARSNTC